MRARTHAGALRSLVITELDERSAESTKIRDTTRKWTAVNQVEGIFNVVEVFDVFTAEPRKMPTEKNFASICWPRRTSFRRKS